MRRRLWRSCGRIRHRSRANSSGASPVTASASRGLRADLAVHRRTRCLASVRGWVRCLQAGAPARQAIASLDVPGEVPRCFVVVVPALAAGCCWCCSLENDLPLRAVGDPRGPLGSCMRTLPAGLDGTPESHFPGTEPPTQMFEAQSPGNTVLTLSRMAHTIRV